MQKAGRKDARGALSVLAEFYRKARVLWPLSSDDKDCDQSVTIRIDAIKGLEILAITHPSAGHGFILQKQNSQDGMVKLLELENFKEIDHSTHEILRFNRYQRLS